MQEFKVSNHTAKDKHVISKLIKDLVTNVTSISNQKITPNDPERIIFNPTSKRSVNRPIIAEILGTHYIAMSEVIDVSINGKVNQKFGPDIPFNLFFNITWDDKAQKLSDLNIDSGKENTKSIEICDNDCVLSDAVFRMAIEGNTKCNDDSSYGHCRGVLLFDKKSY